MEGTREQICAQLLASIDAFFDIYKDPPYARRSSSLRSRKGEREVNLGVNSVTRNFVIPPALSVG